MIQSRVTLLRLSGTGLHSLLLTHRQTSLLSILGKQCSPSTIPTARNNTRLNRTCSGFVRCPLLCKSVSACFDVACNMTLREGVCSPSWTPFRSRDAQEGLKELCLPDSRLQCNARLESGLFCRGFAGVAGHGVPLQRCACILLTFARSDVPPSNSMVEGLMI